MLNLNYLNTFLVAARTGKLTTTAKQVYLSHSAVSTQIKKLEKGLGTTLFIRNQDHLTLTHSGNQLAKYATEILELNDQAFANLKGGQTGRTLTIGIPTDYALLYARFIYPEIQRLLPDYLIKVHFGRSRNLRREIKKGSINIAMVAMEPQYHDDLQLWSEKLYWVKGKQYQFTRNDLNQVALFSDNCVMNDYALDSLKNANFNFQITYYSTMMDNLVTGVDNGLAIALLPESLVTTEHRVLPTDVITCHYRLSIGICYSGKLTAILSELTDCIQAGINKGLTQIYPYSLLVKNKIKK